MTVLTQDVPRGNRQNSRSESDDMIVAEWPINRRETARVTLALYKGAWLINLRKWFEGDDGEIRPGKGLALGAKHLPRLAEAIAKALTEARARGIIAVDHEGDK